ncbi:MAG: MarR family winged helix-turn-helix transcriptional regulator [Nitriliruptorales bacterium]
MCAHAALSRALDEALESSCELPLLTYEVLARLAEAPGRRLRMQELAELLPVTKSGLTRLVDRMERAGLARRELCPSDRRGTFAALTQQGREALERAGEVEVRVLRERLTDLEEEELAALRTACAKIATAQRRRTNRS